MTKPSSGAPFVNIVDAIRRGKGSWSLSVQSGRVMLAAGAAKAVTAAGGFIVTIGLSRADLLQLRDAVNDALSSLGPPS